MTQSTQVDDGEEEIIDLWFYYDASGTPYALKYQDEYFYYATNAQGDVTGILNSFGNEIAAYTYDAWGNLLTTTGTHALANLNPLRYRGYVYDQETELYYLQSRYYNPEVGRFLNADAYASTGQGLLGNNMFAYCNNNPVIYFDPYGNRIVGVGFQFDITIGGVSVGFEIVIYFDSTVCGDSDYLIATYSYGGTELSNEQMNILSELVTLLSSSACIDEVYEGGKEYGKTNDFLSCIGPALVLQILAGIAEQGGSATGAVYLIDGNDSFTSADSYSGAFTTYSGNVSTGVRTGSAFLATSSTCSAVGLKYGISAPGIKGKSICPVSISMSRTYYSAPTIWN